MKKEKKKKGLDVEPTTESFIIFMEHYPKWQVGQLKRFIKPTVINGTVNINKYKITIEKIEEDPKETLFRLKRIYLDEDNWHNKEAIDDYCKKHFGKRMYAIIEEEKEK